MRYRPDLVLLPDREAADVLGVSVARMQRWRWEGQGPAYVRVGGPRGRAVRYRLCDLEAWIEDNRVDPVEAAGANK